MKEGITGLYKGQSQSKEFLFHSPNGEKVIFCDSECVIDFEHFPDFNHLRAQSPLATVNLVLAGILLLHQVKFLSFF